MKYFYKYFTARVVLLTLAMLLSSPLIAWAQGTITIKGVVTDVEKEPLTGVSIRVKGTPYRGSLGQLPSSSPTSG